MRPPTFEQLRNQYPGYATDIGIIEDATGSVPMSELGPMNFALQRYLLEGHENTYKTNPSALVELIKNRELIRPGQSALDLGAGSGDLVTALAELYPESQVTGIDLSPSFVDRFGRERTALSNALMQVGVIDCPLRGSRRLDPQSAVMSVLTLDRLRDPQQLIANMAKFSGAKVLACLLPNNPVDDNPSRQNDRIVYTTPEKRVTKRDTVSGNIAELNPLLEQTWGASVSVDTVPYTVSSSGDKQVYDLTVFYTAA